MFKWIVLNRFYLTAKQAAITHGHPDGFYSAGVYSAIVFELINENFDMLKILNIIRPLDIWKVFTYGIHPSNSVINTGDHDIAIGWRAPPREQPPQRLGILLGRAAANRLARIRAEAVRGRIEALHPASERRTVRP